MGKLKLEINSSADPLDSAKLKSTSSGFMKNNSLDSPQSLRKEARKSGYSSAGLDGGGTVFPSVGEVFDRSHEMQHRKISG